MERELNPGLSDFKTHVFKYYILLSSHLGEVMATFLKNKI